MFLRGVQELISIQKLWPGVYATWQKTLSPWTLMQRQQSLIPQHGPENRVHFIWACVLCMWSNRTGMSGHHQTTSQGLPWQRRGGVSHADATEAWQRRRLTADFSICPQTVEPVAPLQPAAAAAAQPAQHRSPKKCQQVWMGVVSGE